MVFIESRPFTKRLRELTGGDEDDVLRGIQAELLEHPERGKIVGGLEVLERRDSLVQGEERASAADIGICFST